MKFSVEIILIIIIGIIILFNACSETEYFSNVTGTTIAGADIDAIRNLNSYAKTLMQPDGTLTNPGNLNVVGKITSKGIISNGVVSDWITGSFGGSPYRSDRVVLGTLAHTAVVGAHNNNLNAWTPIQLQGSTVIIEPNDRIINFPNGWTINVSDGHFRIRHNGVDKFVVHKDGLPIYTPNGLDVGTWVGTGGGTLNVSGNVNVVGNTKTKQLNADLVDIKPATTHYRAGVEGVGLRLGGMRISGQDNDPTLITINSEATGTSEDQWTKSTTNIGVESHKRKGY
jgi:hypothetical protein